MNYPHTCKGRRRRFNTTLCDCVISRTGLVVCFFVLAVAPASAADNVAPYKKLSLQELMDLEVISASRRPEKLSDTASAIQVITGNDIRRSGATSIPEALRLATNLNIAQRNSQAWAISARGVNTELRNKLLVLMNGRTLFSPLFSGTFWDAQDYVLDDLDRIEVLRGPGSARWGANAVNGVIAIPSKSAKDTQGLFTEVATGTELRNLTNVRYGARSLRISIFESTENIPNASAAFWRNGSDSSTDCGARAPRPAL
jgi:outer membrane cobalamin receptor